VLWLGLEKKLEAREPAQARAGSAQLGEAREPKRARAEPNSMARYNNEPTRANSVRLASRLEGRPKQLLTRGPRKANPRKYRPMARVQEGAYFAALLARVSRRLVACSPARRHSGAIGHQPSSSAQRGTNHQPPAVLRRPPVRSSLLPWSWTVVHHRRPPLSSLQQRPPRH
jgi:hypothetical protein